MLMRDWFIAHNGQDVTTIQAGPRGTWEPGARLVDATQRKGGVFLGDSFRDYAGCRVVSATDTALIVYNADFETTITYEIEGR